MTKRIDEDNSWKPPGAERALWSALVVDSGVAVKIVSADGVIVWANEAFADLVGAPDAPSLIGKNPSEYLPADFAVEALTVMRSVSLSGQSAMVRTIWGGRPTMGLIRPILMLTETNPLTSSSLMTAMPLPGRSRPIHPL